MPTRRDFLKTSTLLALAPTVPGFLARTARAAVPEKDRRVLVIVQLDGGNDGFNTVIPYADPEYAKLRPSLKQDPKRLIKLADGVGLHRSLTTFGKLLDRGQLAVIPGVGYPNPSRSHFRSMAVWQTARFDPEEHNGLGWLGRALDGDLAEVSPVSRAGPGAARLAAPTGAPGALLVGDSQPPVALRGRRSVAAALDRPDEFALAPEMVASVAGVSDPGYKPTGDDLAAFVRRSTLDAYATAGRLAAAGASTGGTEYPASALAGRLKLVAQMLKADLGVRVYYTIQGGYDTHATQQFTHANLLTELSEAMAAFFTDLTAAKLADRVMLLAFSEFGRTIRENGSGGTDHGTAGPVFLAGPRVKAGLIGSMPSSTQLEEGEPVMTIDFRRVYATVLEDWLRLPAAAAVGGEFEALAAGADVITDSAGIFVPPDPLPTS